MNDVLIIGLIIIGTILFWIWILVLCEECTKFEPEEPEWMEEFQYIDDGPLIENKGK